MAISLRNIRARAVLNGRLRVLALVLASITVFAVRQVTSGVSELEVPVVIEVEEGTAVLSQEVQTVTLTCRGAEDDLAQLDARKISAVVRATPHTVPGTGFVTVGRRNIQGRFRGVSLLRVDPPRFSVSFDREISQQVVVARPELAGTPGIGKAQVEHEPKTVTVRGPASRVEQLRILVPEPVSVAGQVNSFSTTTPIQIGDADQGLTIDPPEVTARISIVTDSVSRSWTNVPVRVLGEPGDAQRAQLDPPFANVTLYGAGSALNGISSPTFRLLADCTGLSTGTVHRVPIAIHLPPGLQVSASVEPPTVRVQLEAIE